MNTVAVRNPDLSERRSLVERALMAFYRRALPPANDNETAARYLRETVGSGNEHIEWCSARPDSLVDADVSPYDVLESPVSSIFSGRPTSRSNVASFMVELIDNAELWNTWKFQMPVIMNSQASNGANGQD